MSNIIDTNTYEMPISLDCNGQFLLYSCQLTENTLDNILVISYYDTLPKEITTFSVQISKMLNFIDFSDTFPIEISNFSVQISKNVKI